MSGQACQMPKLVECTSAGRTPVVPSLSFGLDFRALDLTQLKHIDQIRSCLMLSL